MTPLTAALLGLLAGALLVALARSSHGDGWPRVWGSLIVDTARLDGLRKLCPRKEEE